MTQRRSGTGVADRPTTAGGQSGMVVTKRPFAAIRYLCTMDTSPTEASMYFAAEALTGYMDRTSCRSVPPESNFRSEGLVVRFTVSDEASWVGNFQRGEP